MQNYPLLAMVAGRCDWFGRIPENSVDTPGRLARLESGPMRRVVTAVKQFTDRKAATPAEVEKIRADTEIRKLDQSRELKVGVSHRSGFTQVGREADGEA